MVTIFDSFFYEFSMIKSLLRICINCIRVFLNYNRRQKIKFVLDYIYSIWLYPEFKFCGKKVFFKRTIELRGADCITIGDRSSFGCGNILTAWKDYMGETFSPQIIIGKNSNFGDYNHITAINCVRIGNGVLTGRWVTITDNSHGMTDYETLQTVPILRKLYSKGPVTINDNVWIGDKVTILPNVIIGEGSVVAANSVVTRNVPPNSIVAGNPAKVIKTFVDINSPVNIVNLSSK